VQPGTKMPSFYERFISEDHPYYAKTDENGNYKLTDVPAGEYEVKVWQEKLGEQTAEGHHVGVFAFSESA
jgi:hypothetical protein